MLTDTALRNLKAGAAPYKLADREGMYVTVSTAGTIAFRYDYRLSGRRETLTIGRYGPAGISLAMARKKLDGKLAIGNGKSPAMEKQREKRRLTEANIFGEFAVKWLAGAKMAETTRSMRKSIVDRDITPVFKNRLLGEIGADDLRALCQKVKAQRAPANAVHVRSPSNPRSVVTFPAVRQEVAPWHSHFSIVAPIIGIQAPRIFTSCTLTARHWPGNICAAMQATGATGCAIAVNPSRYRTGASGCWKTPVWMPGCCVRLAFAPTLEDGMAYVYGIRTCQKPCQRHRVLAGELAKLLRSPSSLQELHTLFNF